MKRVTILFSIAILFFSCTTEYKPRNINKVTIKEFNMDSMSIRAIQHLDKDRVIYASSTGEIGYFWEGEKTRPIHFPKYKDSISPNFRSLFFNNDEIFALSIGNPALLYKISEGKSTLVYKEEHKKVFYDAMQFFDDTIHGIAVGDPTETCPSIILTADAGKTWTKLSCNNLPVFEEGEAFFAASNTNIKTIGSTVWIASGGKKSRILKSNDYGKTWKIYNTPIIQGNGSQGMYSIDFYDKNIGIAIGGDYSKPTENTANKAVTFDGGKTWTLVANAQAPNYKSCVQYVPETDGKEIFAVGKTGITFSNNRGKTWKTVADESYYTIQFVDKNTAWLSGNKKLGKLDLSNF